MRKEAVAVLNKEKIAFMDLEPIGHHSLNRNYVFLVKGKEDLIFKFYGKKVKYLCEKRALSCLKTFKEIPKLKSSGDDNVPWILMNKIEGALLQEVWESVSRENRNHLLRSMGELLGRLHNQQTQDYFGLWEDLSPIPPENNFIKYRIKNDNRIMEKIRNQNLPDKKIFEEAYDELKNLYTKLDPDTKGVICHRDYSFRNILVTKENNNRTIKGLIDFEHCQIDDPAIDFNTLYQYQMLNTDDMEKAFFEGYEKYMARPGDFKERKKYYMINLGLHTCSWSYEKANNFYNSGVRLLKSIL